MRPDRLAIPLQWVLANWECVVLVLLIVFYLITAAILFQDHKIPVLNETDGVEYMLRADGPFFTIDPYHGPGYPVAVKVAKLLGLGTFNAAKLVSVFFGTVIIVVLHLIVRSFSTPAHGIVTAAITAVSPLFLFMSTAIMSDVMGAAAALCTLALLIVPDRVTRWHFAAAGICASIAYLTRNMYAYLLVFPLVTGVLGTEKRKIKDSLVGTSIFFFAFLFFGLPWFVFIAARTGSPVWNHNHLIVAYKVYFNASGWANFPSEADFPRWKEVVGKDFGLFVQTWWGTVKELPQRLSGFVAGVGVLGIVGVLAWFMTMNRRKAVFLAASVGFAALVCLVQFYARVYFFLLAITASFVAAGFVLLPGRLGSPEGAGTLRRVIGAIPVRATAVVLFLILLSSDTRLLLQRERGDPPVEYREAGQWIREHSGGDDVSVMAAKPHIAFFAKAHHISFWRNGLGKADLDQLPALLAEHQPTYLVFDMRYANRYFPMLRPLGRTLREPYSDFLELVHIVRSRKRVVIYKYNGANNRSS